MADEARNTAIRHVLRSTVSNYVGNSVSLGVWIILTPFILHELGATLYGLWVLVSSVVAYASLLNSGITGAITKYLAEYRAREETERARSLIATAFGLCSVIGLIVVAFSALISSLFPHFFNVPAEKRTLAVYLFLVSGLRAGLSIPCATTSAVLRGLQRFDLVNFIGIVSTLLSALATVTVLFLGGSVISLVWAELLVMLVIQAPSIWCIHRAAPELRFGWRSANGHLVRTILSFSSSMFVLHLGGRLETKTDEIVVAAFLPIQAVTPYDISRKLSTVAQVLTDQFMKVLLPLASELHAQDKLARLRSLYIVSTRLTLAIFVPFGLILVILAQPILNVWVGTDYGGFGHLVLILTLASLIDTSQWPAGSILQGMGRHRLPALLSICSGLANLGLSIVLVQTFGITGVALGTLIPTSIVCLGFLLPYTMRLIGVGGREVVAEMFLPALIPAIPVGVLTFFLREIVKPSSLLSILAVVSIGLVFYLVGYFAVSARQLEREACRHFALSTVRLAEDYLKRR